MVDPAPGPRRQNRLWLVLLVSLAILVLVWVIMTVLDSEGSSNEQPVPLNEEALTAPGDSLESPPPVTLPDGGLVPLDEAMQDPDHLEPE